jgi:hypothetical protein
VFAASEAALLLSASDGPYDVPAFARVKGPPRLPQVEVDRAVYSAPKEYLGQHLDAPAGSAVGKRFHRGELVNGHRWREPGQRVIDPAGRRGEGHEDQIWTLS